MLRSGLLLVLLALAQLASARILLADTVTTLSGKAIIISRDVRGQQPQRMLGVRTPDGKRVHVAVADPQQLAALHTGMHVELTGRWAQQAQLAARTGGVAAAVAAAPSPAAPKFVAASLRASGAAFAAPTLTKAAPNGGSSAGTGFIAAAPAQPATVLSSNALVFSAISTIVVPIAGVTASRETCLGTGLPRFTVSQVKQAVFAEANPAGITVGSTYNKCSYGKAQLTMNNSLVADTVELPCEGNTNGVAWTFSRCDFDDFNGYADAADQALTARGIDLSLYQHRVYLIPRGACNFVGLGYVGCDGSFDCRSWIGADFWASPAAVAHEIGHNLFMGHAGAAGPTGGFDEYADLSGLMGYCCSDRCPNTPHAWQLGWVSLQQLDGTSLKPGRTVTTFVASQSLSARSGLRILPSWAAGLDPVFVGYRTKAGGDVATEQAGTPGKLHIYTAPITNSYDAQPTTWKTALTTGGQAWVHPTAGLVVRVLIAGPTSAKVTVCRKGGTETLASCRAGVDNDCNGLAGAADPTCARILKRVRRPALAKPTA